jgi:hypothetical protein
MLRIILRHLTGSRATEVDVIPLGAHRELILACGLGSCALRPDHESFVGRYHARIAPSDEEPARLILADLKSRNGTFVNGARIECSVVLSAGDVVRLGECGPEIEVQMERTIDLPMNSSSVKAPAFPV